MCGAPPQCGCRGQAWQGCVEPRRGRACRAAIGKRAARNVRRRVRKFCRPLLRPQSAIPPCAFMSVFENSEGWVVLKFGGTSVSSVANWRNIAAVLRDRMASNFRPVVVQSAMSGVTDRLEALLSAAIVGGHVSVLDQIERGHRDLAGRLGIVPDA